MKKAFTLAETLASILIIAILASLLLPALRSSVNASKKTICYSNVHQIQLAMTLYKEDLGEYPPSNSEGAEFLPYLKGTKLKCPFADIAQYREPDYRRVQYFLNGYMSYVPKADLECREIRGSSYPLVYDVNHASPFVTRSTGKAFYIYARVDGSVATEDERELVTADITKRGLPCPGASMFSNLK